MYVCMYINIYIYIYIPKQTKTLPIIFNYEKIELFPLKSESKETPLTIAFQHCVGKYCLMQQEKKRYTFGEGRNKTVPVHR